MNCIDVMVEEHQNIKRMLAVIRKLCYKVMKGAKVEYDDFFHVIDFVRNYADSHHHGKEETMLFNRMMDELGSPAEKLVRHGMLVEHDLGRLHMQELESAVKRVMEGDDESRLDIIANAISYTHLLYRHIQKEDEVVYTFARKNLNENTISQINLECSEYELDQKARAVQKKYLALIEEMESKYSA